MSIAQDFPALPQAFICKPFGIFSPPVADVALMSAAQLKRFGIEPFGGCLA